jgi:hypothetical protein
MNDDFSGLMSFSNGSLADMIDKMTSLQAESFLRDLNPDQLRLIHSFTHLLGNQIWQVRQVALQLGMADDALDDGKAPTLSFAMIGYFAAWTMACCNKIGEALGDNAFMTMPMAAGELVAYQIEGQEMTFTSPVTFIEGPVPDLPKEE